MTDALKKEIEEIENKESAESREENVETEESTETAETDVGEDKKTEEPVKNEEEKEPDEEEEKRSLAREKYLERQRQKQNEDQQKKIELHKKHDGGTSEKEEDDLSGLKNQLSEANHYIQKQRRQEMLDAASRELSQIEQAAKKDKEFTQAFPDYDDVVNNAIEFAKIRLIEEGATEAEAVKRLEYEKTLLADRAVASGKDPMVAIYEEGRRINRAFETFAEKMGYSKGIKKKTNLQAQRDASRPNAVAGGAGRGAGAITKKFDELGDDDLDEIKNTNIWDV